MRRGKILIPICPEAPVTFTIVAANMTLLANFAEWVKFDTDVYN